MTFLPVVERELRVEARRALTYWLRVIAAGGLLAVFGLTFTVESLSRGTGFSFGQIIFTVLKWILFVVAAGCVFVASDALSEEKREGTLGLLFLTDLRGYDVVLGKLMSMSLRMFYALLAGLPVIALPLMMGGVTGVEFSRTLLVICNTMFFSLAVGLFVSATSREVLKAMNLAGILNLAFLVGLPWLDMGLAHWESSKWEPIFSIASPGYLFVAAQPIASKLFWQSLALQHAIGWTFLILACVIVPRAWQERSTEKKGWWAEFFARWRFGGTKWRYRFRQKMLKRDPILWLALRDRWLPRFALAVTFLVLTLVGIDVYRHWNDQRFQSLMMYSFLLNLGVTLWLASQASRFYVEAVRSGAMELMLVTPMSSSQIVRSQWKALCRTFLVPVLLLLVFKLAVDTQTIIALKKSFVQIKSAPKGASFPGSYDWIIREMVQMAGNLINFVLWLSALAWFAMWMGVTTRKLPFAIIKAIVLVCLVPWFLELFIMGWSMAMMFAWKLPAWIGAVPPIIVELVKNIFFIALSRRKLMGNFREMVVSRASSEKFKRVPLPPAAALAPPVIS